MIIRPATEEDLSRLVELESHGLVRWGHSGLLQNLKLPQYLHVFVTSRDEVAGFIAFSLAGRQLYIQNVVVDKQHRRQGVGKALVRAALRLGKHENADEILLDVEVGNEAAIGMYRSAGFQIVAKQKGFYSDGSDAYTMKYDHNYIYYNDLG